MNSFQTSGYLNTVETVASLSEDLISSRSAWRKIICAVLCLAFVVDSWVVVILHTVNFTNQSILELVVSITTLLLGQYLVTGIVDACVYWKRWRQSSAKRRSKLEEENKEAWVCMRVALTIIGLAPLSRYIESLMIVIRMVRLEREYMPEAVALAKVEAKQTSHLPAGSLISAPTLLAGNARPAGSSRLAASDASTPFTARRLQKLDHGLMHVQRYRRRFRRSERDAAAVALASGVLGAGPFVITQGVLYFRRVGMNFPMSTATQLSILANAIFGLAWLTTGLTHYYPVPHRQSELEFERGVGQVPFGGLVLLYFTRLVHVILRCGTIVLFTAQFYPIVVAVLGFHYLLVLGMFWVARSCTRPDYSQAPDLVLRSSIRKNIVSDLAFSFVGLFEFLNGYAKFARTRYLIFYFFYYLENASMMGAWYVYFTFPEMWYYLPSLLVITVVQLLGFILLQLYLYIFSKPRRKTTLCGFCFAHRMDTEAVAVGDTANRASDLDHLYSNQPSNQSQLEFTAAAIDGSSRMGRPLGSQLSTSRHQMLPSMWSVGASGSQSAWPKRNAGGLCDPVFGQQIAQSAMPLQKPPESSRRGAGQQYKMRQRPRTTAAPSNLLELPKAADPSRHETWLASQARDTRTRTSIQPGAVPASERNWYQQRSLEDLPFVEGLGRESSVGHVPTIISAEEALEQQLSSSYQSSGRAKYHGNIRPQEHGRKMVVNAYETMADNYNDDDEQPGAQNTGQSGVPSSRLRGKERHSAAVANALPAGRDRNDIQPQKPQRGVFQPAPNQYRKKWPYAPK